jgi:hypothetical protein
MSSYLLALLCIAGGLFATAIGDMASEEVRDRLDHLPHVILRLAALRLDPAERVAIYDDEWLPELIYILQGDEARPVTRLYHGARFALGILVAARRIARDLHRAEPLAEDQLTPSQVVGRAEHLELDDRPQLVSPEPIVLRMLLGTQLRRLREAAGVAPDRAGYEIRASRSKISRMESGHVGFKTRDLIDLLTLYGVTDEQVQASLLAMAQQASQPDWWAQYSDILPGWFESYLGLESVSSTIGTFELQFVNGLFQTQDYARALTLLGHRSAPPSEIERRVRLRLRRQELLAGKNPRRIWAIMDEAVLRRPVGGAAVMRAQLHRLIDAATLPHVTLQVLPFDRGGHAGTSGSFTVLRFEELDLPDVVYIEQLTGAVCLDQRLNVEHYLEVMDQLSDEALSPAASRCFIEQLAAET